MEPKTIVITGASDGIGAAAARRLSALGHRIVVVGRSSERTAAIAAELRADHHLADFSDLTEVHRLAAELLAAYPHIDVLANNAGGIFTDVRQEGFDGNELTFQVNYLAPFLLTSLLHERLLASKATVINTSSAANRIYGRLDLADLNAVENYTASRAYGNAKLAQILFTKEIERRYGAMGLSAAAFHPGIVATGFSSSPGTVMRAVYQNPLAKRLLASPDRGADTLVWLATSEPGVDWSSGGYFARRKPARANKQAADAELARELWDRTEEMLLANR